VGLDVARVQRFSLPHDDRLGIREIVRTRRDQLVDQQILRRAHAQTDPRLRFDVYGASQDGLVELVVAEEEIDADTAGIADENEAHPLECRQAVRGENA
jgi:hypothetical protein